MKKHLGRADDPGTTYQPPQRHGFARGRRRLRERGAQATAARLGLAPEQSPERIGYHYLLELSGCPAPRLDDPQLLQAALHDAAEQAQLTALGEISHRFEPQGVTAILLLAESHLAIHTWPESGYAAVDLFSCGSPARAERACRALADALGATAHHIERVERGRRGPAHPR